MDLNERVGELGIHLDDGDGLLLVQTTSRGTVIPHILALGLMTEGRIEASIMSIYTAIVKERTRAASEAQRRLIGMGTDHVG